MLKLIPFLQALQYFQTFGFFSFKVSLYSTSGFLGQAASETLYESLQARS